MKEEERPAIHGLAMRMKPGPSGRIMTTEELPPGCQDRVDQGQAGTGDWTKVRIKIFLVSTFYTIFFTSLILSLLESIGEKPWYLTSRRLFILKIVFCVPDLTLLPFTQEEVRKQ